MKRRLVSLVALLGLLGVLGGCVVGVEPGYYGRGGYYNHGYYGGHYGPQRDWRWR